MNTIEQLLTLRALDIISIPTRTRDALANFCWDFARDTREEEQWDCLCCEGPWSIKVNTPIPAHVFVPCKTLTWKGSCNKRSTTMVATFLMNPDWFQNEGVLMLQHKAVFDAGFEHFVYVHSHNEFLCQHHVKQRS